MRLRIMSDEGRMSVLELSGKTLIIGRDERCDIPLPADLTVSQQHAQLRSQGERVELVDLASTNGTFLGGNPIRGRVLLSLGDEFQVGRTRIRLEALGSNARDSAPIGVSRRRGRAGLVVAAVVGGALLAGVALAAVDHFGASGGARAANTKTTQRSGSGGGPTSRHPSTTAPATTFTPGLVTKLERATVLIYDVDRDGNLLGSGSGTIISPDGLILTNAHVGAPDAPGLGLSEGAVEPAPATLEVALVDDPRRNATPSYRATPVAWDGYLDVAVLQITSMEDGSPVTPQMLKLPSVQLGNSGGVRPGQTIGVIGYPGIGGGQQGSVDFSVGTVSGFVGDPLHRLHGAAWIKTDARIAPGNSGGLAASANGLLIGIPTQNVSQTALNPNQPQDVSEGRIRPVNALRPVIEAAMTGTGASYQSPYFVPATERESIRFTGFSDGAPGSCSNYRSVDSYPPDDSSRVTANWDVSGVAHGEDWQVRWTVTAADGSTKTAFEQGVWKRSWRTKDTCFSATVPSPLGDGTYEAEFRIGPNLETSRVGAGSTVVGSAPPATS
jgi:S1-C subfamily serine protease